MLVSAEATVSNKDDQVTFSIIYHHELKPAFPASHHIRKDLNLFSLFIFDPNAAVGEFGYRANFK